MRTSALVAAGALALALSACGKQAADNAAETAAANAGANAEPEIPSPAMINSTMPAEPAPTIAGAFVAVSNTAMSVTGDVTIAADRLSFALDQDYGVGAVTTTTAGTPYAGDDSWADLFGVTPDTPVEIRPVTSQRIGAKARNGGMCGPDRASFVAIARKAPGTPDELLQISAFQGAAAPGQGAAVENLCGTFTYIPRAAAAAG